MTLHVKIDAVLCSGHGRCAKFAPEYYKLDDNGYNLNRGQTLSVPPDQEALARKGAKFCPEQAIQIIDT
jgi:ferredoxin